MPVTTPDWVKDAVFYQIYPDRFTRSAAVAKPANLRSWHLPPKHRGFTGGDLLGVVERLDYLQALGVTALYLNPIFQAASDHRYNTHNYYSVDPLLGGDAALRALLDACHARGMRVVLDGVFNHCGRGFFQFTHLLECGAASPYVDWFHLKDGFPLNAYDPDRRHKPNYAAWYGHKAVPKFNTANPQVRAFLLDVAEHWIRFGIDGWRLDAPDEIDDDSFWQELRVRVKALNPDAYLVGELWGAADRWLQGDQFDAVTNYLFLRPALGFFGQDTLRTRDLGGDYKAPPVIDAAEFARQVGRAIGRYDWQVALAQMNILGTHDTPRLLTMFNGDQSAVQLSTLCMLTLPGAPTLFYGDEIGLEGRHDPDCRQPMRWDVAEARPPLWGYMQQAIALRQAHAVLRRGAFRAVLAEGTRLAYLRELDGVRALVVLNAGRGTAAFDLPVGGLRRVVFGAPQGHLALHPTRVTVTVPPRAGVVLM